MAVVCSQDAQEQTKLFFDCRKSPTQAQCDQLALSIPGASKVSPVDNPGSLSYTVVCKGCLGPLKDLIVSFRETGGMLDECMVALARKIHGGLVPELTCHGNVEGADPPLFIYSMSYLRGCALIEVQSVEIEMSSDEEAKHERLIRHLARYFARCWSNPQTVDLQTQVAQRARIHNLLTRLVGELPPSALSKPGLSCLIDSLDSSFNQIYPRIFTHNDFSVTKILLDEKTFDITDTFWDEFWHVSGIEEEDCWGRIKASAEAAAKIWAVLRLAFRCNADGSPSDEVLVSKSRMEQLRAWLRE
ncbi:hypothetical protein F5883DRAFT_625925 [Diaporthe sp. PMI_573]|nr:hypothetical protein F5883DRAFT_625925 [Diaporthaceae sp. PMI_573]